MNPFEKRLGFDPVELMQSRLARGVDKLAGPQAPHTLIAGFRLFAKENEGRTFTSKRLHDWFVGHGYAHERPNTNNFVAEQLKRGTTQRAGSLNHGQYREGLYRACSVV